MSESSAASGTTEYDWCQCGPEEIDPACRHALCLEFEERLRSLRAQRDMILRWHGAGPRSTYRAIDHDVWRCENDEPVDRVPCDEVVAALQAAYNRGDSDGYRERAAMEWS